MKKRRMFGRLIRNIRDLQNISREELSRGICSVKALEKYESGEREPEKLVADALLQRLKKSMDKFEILLDQAEYQQAKKRLEIQGLLRLGKLCEAKLGIEEYGKICNPLHYQYTCFLRAEFLRKKSAPQKDQIENVVEGIYQTLDVGEKNTIHRVRSEEKYGQALKPEILAAGRYSKMEILLFERYAILLFKSGNKKEALCWYQEIITYLKDEAYDKADQYALCPIMAYQLAIYYEEVGEYAAAMEQIYCGCDMLRQKKEQLALFCKLMELKFRIEDHPESGIKGDNEEREDYKRLCDAVPGKLEDWKQNWYPIYGEKHLLCFNDIIRERRRAKGMSKEELAYDNCDVRTLERIESGQNTPRAENREKFLEKLGLSTEKYNGGIVTGRYEDYRNYGKMMKLCVEDKYQEARKIYEELKKCMNTKNITNAQWIEYWDVQIKEGLNHISEREKETRFWNILWKTISMKKGSLSFVCQLFENERNILNQLLGKATKGKQKLYEIMLRQIQGYYQKGERGWMEPEYLIQLFLSLGNFFRLEKNFSLALRYLHMAENRMILYDEWNVWEYILCYKQLVLQEMDTEKDFSCVQQAYAISRLYARNPQMSKYLLKEFEKDIKNN